ncbi:MAG TPA: hypothetical protein DHW71_16340 [Gammaproteobacteria bacterium]|nr:hypothetical protein [Gammaproteobacteria bacterium]HBF09418.1 hypothetical protein [Gammaproteobacteria bacterium]HCK94566.1 hypothetical protein [Gammaproteobacteria bacterium]|tara:strand:- start:135 stop:716 length:582 start_codon:yes stop_codon:yes gene_type:complete
MPSRNIYQIKISLSNSKPPIWRRLLVWGDMSLPKLHLAIQIAMGWCNGHLHQFIKNDRFYGVIDDEFPDPFGDTEDETQFKLCDLIKKEKDVVLYEYDFGDSWMHKITLEKVLKPDPALTYPLCIKGKKACPPEDSGGIWGYYNMLNVIADETNEDYEEYAEWLGDAFDPEYFSVSEVNEELQNSFTKSCVVN